MLPCRMASRDPGIVLASCELKNAVLRKSHRADRNTGNYLRGTCLQGFYDSARYLNESATWLAAHITSRSTRQEAGLLPIKTTKNDLIKSTLSQELIGKDGQQISSEIY